MIADGKVYLGNDDGDVAVFALSPKLNLLAKNSMREAVYTTPVAVDGVLYIASHHHLVAIGESKRP